ncbi:MAG: exo-alpha-sialidase [Nitrospirae bacterium]|nr:exo-alpha-sialidase [Nitrospirota bacterium]
MKLMTSILVISAALSAIAGCGAGGGGGGLNNGGSSVVNLSKSANDSSKPVISANSRGDVYVAWEEVTGNPKKEIYLEYSSNSGANFFPPENIASWAQCKTNPEDSGDFILKTGDNGDLYIAWIEKSPGTSSVMFYSDPSQCKLLSAVTTGTVSSPRLAMNGSGNIGIAWKGNDSGGGEIYYSYSVNKGGTFSSPLNLSETLSSDSSEPLLSVEGSFNFPKAVWVEGEGGSRTIVSSQFTNWDGDIAISEPVSVITTDASCPVILPVAGGPYLVYKGDNSIQFSAWNPILPPSFGMPNSISPGSVSPSCPQAAATPDGAIYSVWSDQDSVWFAVSGDWGVHFTKPLQISSGTGISSSPVVAAAGSNIVIVWEGYNGSSKDIFLSVSKDMGQNFSVPKNLSNTPAPSSSPYIATDSKKSMYVAWEEGIAGEREIYFLKYRP